MSTGRVLVPGDAAAVSVGADEVAAAFEAAGAEVVRTGSRGMLWLEPLVEVETDAGRVGHANVAPGDVAAVLAGEAADIGVVDQHPWLTSQQRVSFVRVGVVDPASVTDYEAHGGWAGLRRALSLSPGQVVQEVTDSGLRGRGVRASRPASSGRRSSRPPRTSSSSPATSTRATPAPSPTGWSSRVTRSR